MDEGSKVESERQEKAKGKLLREYERKRVKEV